ncbi:MAG: glutamate formimidoyltransferase [Symbiobacteriaceae bacterium]|nr:glutamate formimidoyltransferase [Symbiobacteriaceae bacterium]
MPRLVECIPNFSEGRRPEVIAEILEAIRRTPGCQLLDSAPDPSHNRVVVTFLGEPEAVLAGAYNAIEVATRLIDMTTHTGEHPRLGATDVVPFVPISEVDIDECVELAEALGAKVAQELKIPVYLYESAARTPNRRNLADVRRGEYEGLIQGIKEPERHPDFGEAVLHPTAGAIVIGARKALVAFNVNLATDDIDIARAIARKVRGSSGGFVHVKALGVMLEERNIAQVSMNLVDFEGTSLHHTFEFIKREAARYGVNILASEIIGLLPQQALIEAALWYLQVEEFDEEQILENRLKG